MGGFFAALSWRLNSQNIPFFSDHLTFLPFGRKSM
jgi:hypothetical protein